MENILIPRNLEGRKEKLKQMNIKLLSQEVIDGDLILDESFMDIDAKFVKLKKVNGFVTLQGCKWIKIPVWLKDVEIQEGFNCSFNKLVTLENSPHKTGGGFWCDHNKLTTLINCPQKIGKSFWCHNNLLTSLEGCPETIRGDFNCKSNKAKLELPKNVKLKGLFKN